MYNRVEPGLFGKILCATAWLPLAVVKATRERLRLKANKMDLTNFLEEVVEINQSLPSPDEEDEKVPILNPNQQAVVDMPPGTNIKIVASAGSGKTRTMVYRYLKLREDGVPSGNIAVVTFTVKAANTIRDRILEEVPYLNDTAKKNICTINAFCFRRLKVYWMMKKIKKRKVWEYRPNGPKNPIYVAEDIIGKEYRNSGYDEIPQVADLLYLDTILKRKLAPTVDHAIKICHNNPVTGNKMWKCWLEYTKYFKENNLIDLPGMVALYEQALIREPLFRNTEQNTFREVIVDEGHDTSRQAFRILVTVSQVPGWNEIYKNVKGAK